MKTIDLKSTPGDNRGPCPTNELKNVILFLKVSFEKQKHHRIHT
jgi:hypothetical protein